MPGFGGTPPTAGQRRFVHTTVHVHAPVRPPARRRRAARLRAGRGAAQPARRHAGGTGTGGPPGGAGRADPHSCGRADARKSTTAIAWSRHATGRVAADAGQRRRALVHRARDAHDGEGSRRPGRERRRGRPRADHRGRPGRWHVSRRAPISPRAAASASAAIRTRSSIPFAELRQFEWSQRIRARSATCWRRGRRCRSARRSGRAPRAAARRRVAQPVGAIEAGRRADLVVLNIDDPALAGQAADDVLDAAIFGPCRAPGARRHGAAAGGSCATAGTRARMRCSRAIAPRLRASDAHRR